MPQFSPQDLARYQALADQDPEVQRAKQRMQGARGAWPAPRPSWLPPGLQIEGRSGAVVPISTLGGEFSNPQWWATMAGLGTLGATSLMSAGPAVSSMAGAGANAGTKAVSNTFGADDIPTLPSNDYGTGMASLPSSIPTSSNWSGVSSMGGQFGGNYANDAANAASGFPWGDVIKTAVPIVGGIAANRLNQPDPSAGGMGEMPPELRELLNLQLNRIRQSQPNYELMLNMARGMTPQWARDMPSPSGSSGGGGEMADLISRMAQVR